MVSFAQDTASEMLYPVLPVFVTSVLGAAPGVVGLIEGVAEATASITKGAWVRLLLPLYGAYTTLTDGVRRARTRPSSACRSSKRPFDGRKRDAASEAPPLF